MQSWLSPLQNFMLQIAAGPQFNLEAAGYGRGTGAETNGQKLDGANGLAPNVGNYAVGLNVTFGFLDFVSIHAPPPYLPHRWLHVPRDEGYEDESCRSKDRGYLYRPSLSNLAIDIRYQIKH
jgi:hypothetical protein